VQVRDRTSDPKALLEIANSDEVQQVALAPVNTGRLRRNILIEAVTNLDTGIQGYAVGWGDRAFYGQMVEFGTEHTRPRPHLVPAAIKNGGRGFGGGR
jgi:HK97 gp10 family phage protein